MIGALSEREREAITAWIAEHVAPLATRIDAEGVPLSLVRKMAERGFLGWNVAARHGGVDSPDSALGWLHEALGRVSGSVRAVLVVHAMVARAIGRFGSAGLAARLLPALAEGRAIGAFALSEPSVGSDAAGVQARAEQRGEGFVLSGAKRWLTWGQHADVFLVFARAEAGLCAFLVERTDDGASCSPMPQTMGLSGAALGELSLEQVEVDAERLVGRPGSGVSLVAADALDLGRYLVACGAVGLMAGAIEAGLAHARGRSQFGARLSEHPLIQEHIAYSLTDLQAARALCAEVGRLRDEGDPESIERTFAAKLFATRAASRVADRMLQVHGAAGLLPDAAAQRFFRDARVGEIIEGTNEIAVLMLGRLYAGASSV